MALDPIGALISVGSTAANLFNDKKNREHQEDVNNLNWERQLEMWNMTNEYNAPIAQRKRLEEAGFNPNLAIGSIQNTASNQNLPNATPVTRSRAGEIIQQGFQDFLQSQNIQANTFKQTADAIKSEESAGLTKEQREQLEGMRGTNLSIRESQLNNLLLEEQRKTIQNSQMPAQHKAAMSESTQRLINMRSVLTTEQLNQAIKREELELRKLGINPNTDGLWTRLIGQLMSSIGISPFEYIKQGAKSWYKHNLMGEPRTIKP